MIANASPQRDEGSILEVGTTEMLVLLGKLQFVERNIKDKHREDESRHTYYMLHTDLPRCTESLRQSGIGKTQQHYRR